MLQYILECIAFQLVFLVIYDLFLKRETFFQWNRVYLLGTHVISMVLPWVKIEALKTRLPQPLAGYPEFLWRIDSKAITVQSAENPLIQMSWQEGVIYSGMIVTAVLFVFKLRQLYQLKKRGKQIKYADFTQIIISNSALAFSFFRSIFLGDKIVAKEHDTIIAHELVHIKQGHTWDLLFFEVMRIVSWFNPLVYVYQNRTSELHEFIADAQVAKERKAHHYQQLLSQVFETEHISFINQFFTKSLIKKRIVMLQKSKSRKIWQLKYLVLLPILIGMLFYTSCEEGIEDKVAFHQSIGVQDIENLTVDEENQIMAKLIDLSAQPQEWSLVVKDAASVVTFTKAPEGSGISGPGNEMIPARMHIESNVLDEDFDLFHFDATKPIQLIMQSNTVPFAVIDQVPIFPGCEDAQDPRACFNERIQKHISKHFNYPQEAQDLGIEGRVSVIFTIDTNGDLRNIKQRGPHKLLEDEVERIIKKLPQMTPGQHKGEAVNVPFSIPVTFKLQRDVSKAKLKHEENEGGGDLMTSLKEEPLYILNGEETTSTIIIALNPNEIDNVSVLKKERALEKYGEKGRNGVVEVTLKELK
jgi:TonB family protein